MDTPTANTQHSPDAPPRTAALAAELRRRGWTYREIGAYLHIGASTACALARRGGAARGPLPRTRLDAPLF